MEKKLLETLKCLFLYFQKIKIKYSHGQIQIVKNNIFTTNMKNSKHQMEK
jgi:hypothetical protein